jgi:hypothetical protein
VANIGLCLFLFLVGLEIDSGVIKRNARLSATIGLAGMVIPFGFGAALAVPLYHKFISPDTVFTHFMLFTGVAYSITAFPVLCRILTELKLLDTTVGIVVLSAGVANDIGKPLCFFLCFLTRTVFGFSWLDTPSIECRSRQRWFWPYSFVDFNDLCWVDLSITFPYQEGIKLAGKENRFHREWAYYVFYDGHHSAGVWIRLLHRCHWCSCHLWYLPFTLVCLFDVNVLFLLPLVVGAFVAGIIVPREGGLTIALTEKLEDMVSIIFLPLVSDSSTFILVKQFFMCT